MAEILVFPKKSEELYSCRTKEGLEIGVIHNVGNFLELDVSMPLWSDEMLKEVLTFMQKLKEVSLAR